MSTTIVKVIYGEPVKDQSISHGTHRPQDLIPAFLSEYVAQLSHQTNNTSAYLFHRYIVHGDAPTLLFRVEYPPINQG